MFKRILWSLRAFVRSHDRSTPGHPRRDGSYGWPVVTPTDAAIEAERRRVLSRYD